MNSDELLLKSLQYRYREIKRSGDRTLSQLDESDIHWQFNQETNSIAIVVQHLHGNMLSRWTDFFTTDGDKPWRNRDGEFESKRFTREQLTALWNEGWDLTLRVIDALTREDLSRKVAVRGQELDVVDACLRQLLHYSMHVGQMVHIAKERLGDRWQTLSIARGKSKEYHPSRKD
jgi:hypothetical protein